MNAVEARATSEKKTAAISKENKERAEKARLTRIANEKAERQKQLEHFRKECRDRIKYATEDGRRKTQVGLSSDSKDLVAQTGYNAVYVDVPAEDKDHPDLVLWGENKFMKNSECASIVKKVRQELEKDGYKVKIIDEHTEHDTSSAYLNSGGECGSETPYYTHDTLFEISW